MGTKEGMMILPLFYVGRQMKNKMHVWEKQQQTGSDQQYAYLQKHHL